MFVSRDGHWKVVSVTLDGQPILRVLHDTPHGAPVHQVARNRAGIVRMAGGWLWADCTSAAQVGQIVPLAELREVKA